MNYTDIENAIKEDAEFGRLVHENSQVVSDKITKELDLFISDLDTRFANGFEHVTDIEIDDAIANLSTLLYSLVNNQESLSSYATVSKLRRQEQYNVHYQNASGTVSERQAVASLSVAENDISALVYKQAENIVKNKMEKATEVLKSLKKIMTKRIADVELSKLR